MIGAVMIEPLATRRSTAAAEPTLDFDTCSEYRKATGHAR